MPGSPCGPWIDLVAVIITGERHASRNAPIKTVLLAVEVDGAVRVDGVIAVALPRAVVVVGAGGHRSR